MTPKEIVNEIKELNIPAKVKAELLMLWFKCREIVEKILAFIRRHKDLAECLILGAIVAFLLSQLPWLGNFLALLALVTSAAVGLMLEMRNALMQVFSLPM